LLLRQNINPVNLFVLIVVVLLATASCAGLHKSTTDHSSPSVAYSVYGEGDTALVFVHGWACDQTYWREQISAFSHDHLVVTLDLSGHGETPAGDGPWSIERFGMDVASVVRRIDADHIVLVGHSMGGPVVLEAATLLPERIIGIVGVDTLHSIDRDLMSPEEAARAFSAFAEAFPTRTEEFVRSAFFLESSATSLIDWIAKDMAAGNPRVAESAFISARTYDLRATLEKLRNRTHSPIVLINAPEPATDFAGLSSAYDTTDLKIIEDTGHFVMLERPTVFNRELREVITDFSGRNKR